MAGLSEDDSAKYTCFFQQVLRESNTSTGELNMEDFEKLLKICGLVMPRRQSSQIFIDTHCDGNWKISLSEFLEFISQVAPSGSPQSVAASLRCHFNKHDLKKDGHMSLDELRTVMGELNLLLDEDWLQSFLEEWGTDSDGRLNFEDFVKVYIRTEYIISGSDVITDMEGQENADQETQSAVMDMKVVIDTVRQICSERGLVKDGMVSVVHLRYVLDELEVNLNKDQVQRCFSVLPDVDLTGNLVLDKFLHTLENSTQKRLDDQGAYKCDTSSGYEFTSSGEASREAPGDKDGVFPKISIEMAEEEELISGEIPREEESAVPGEYGHTDVRKLSATFEGKHDTLKVDGDSHDCGARSVCQGVSLKDLIARFEHKTT